MFNDRRSRVSETGDVSVSKEKKMSYLTRDRLRVSRKIEPNSVTENKRGEVATGVYCLAGQVAFGPAYGDSPEQGLLGCSSTCTSSLYSSDKSIPE